MSDAFRSFMLYLGRYGNHYVLHRNGEPLKRLNKGLGVAYEQANIKDASPHTLKHTAITWMLQSGADMWSVAGFTGTSLKTIESTYGHHAPEYLEAARDTAGLSRARRITAPKTAPQKENAMGKIQDVQ
jgi:integrase